MRDEGPLTDALTILYYNSCVSALFEFLWIVNVNQPHVLICYWVRMLTNNIINLYICRGTVFQSSLELVVTQKQDLENWLMSSELPELGLVFLTWQLFIDQHPLTTPALRVYHHLSNDAKGWSCGVQKHDPPLAFSLSTPLLSIFEGTSDANTSLNTVHRIIYVHMQQCISGQEIQEG